jgi:hypothetical protein
VLLGPSHQLAIASVLSQLSSSHVVRFYRRKRRYRYHPILPVTTTSEVYKPNDGVVLAESAMDFKGAKYIRKLDGSCHFQMRNDESLRENLNWLFGQTRLDLTSFHTKEIQF